MGKFAFLDCPTGIAGDMCLGALVSAGVPLTYLQSQLERLKLPETLTLEANTVHRNGIAATQVKVNLPHEISAEAQHPPLRHLADVESLITAAQLPERVTAWSLAVFRRLAIAEGAVHGTDPQAVHFHEVGATDAIADIVGACLGLDWLDIEVLYCAPLPTGRGTVRAAHGRLPVPAPAVLKLMELAQVPVYNAGLKGELVTPTGAAIATELATHFGDPPAMQLQKVGLGAGSKDFPVPNVLRLWIGISQDEHAAVHSHADPHPHAHPPIPSALPLPPSQIESRQGLETVAILETQVDDLSPQAIGYLCDRLLQLGALDVFTQSVTMKKSRPGHLITVIAYPEKAHACEAGLLQETTTLGVRHTEQNRLRLRRELVAVETALGTIRVKVAFMPGHSEPLKAHPEYEDCAFLAKKHGLPWRDVHNLALCAWHQHTKPIAPGQP